MHPRLLCCLAVAGGILFSSFVSAERIRVATWNVLNYTTMDRRVDGEFRPDLPKPEEEKTVLRRILLEVQPDVLAIQEIGGAGYLEELQRDLAIEGLDYPYSAIHTDSIDSVRRLAVLSMLPLHDVVGHRPELTYFGEKREVLRGVLEVSLGKDPEDRWSLFVVHLKSLRTSRDDDFQSRILRRSEAMASRNVIRKRLPPETNPRYLVLGDFNDTKNSPPVRRFREVSDTTLSTPVYTVGSCGEYWTHHFSWQDSYRRVDMILASPAIEPWIVPDSGVIYSGPDWRTASDHRLVYIDMDIPPS